MCFYSEKHPRRVRVTKSLPCARVCFHAERFYILGNRCFPVYKYILNYRHIFQFIQNIHEQKITFFYIEYIVFVTNLWYCFLATLYLCGRKGVNSMTKIVRIIILALLLLILFPIPCCQYQKRNPCMGSFFGTAKFYDETLLS